VIESLHSHTTLSDGKLSHREAFELAEKLGYGVIAFTDHDSLPSREVVEYLESVRDHKTKWIIGIEITSGVPREMAGKIEGALHMVGLFVDPTNSALMEHCKKVQIARIERVQKIVTNLNALGFIVDNDEVFAKSSGDALALPHIVSAINDHPENEILLDKFVEEFRTAAESDASLRSLYEGMLKRDRSQYIYALFLGKPSYRKGVSAPIGYKVDLDQTAKLVRDAGGVIMIAHYGFEKARDLVPLPLLDDILRDKRIDGMETVYKLNQGEIARCLDEQASIKNMVKKYNAIKSGGADAHSEDDYRDFAKNREFSNDTIGMTAEILRKRPDILKRWTSFVQN